ncbi:hypothetical protein F5884DRAFT_187218 [Xylogone sp. PMI_703]|nr:hypothetical protein F5884DRAFT_187218 [Xylogone sp. PMI_703]
MATFAVPVSQAPQFTTSPTQYTNLHTFPAHPRPLYNHPHQQQPISPLTSGPNTPHNASPTSPRTSHMPTILPPSRQLRPPKSPLYVPAVLRPTDPPRKTTKPSPLTPPTSLHSSFDDLAKAGNIPASRRSTGNLDDLDIDIEGLGKVTALPTRAHWKPDSSASICDDPSCTRAFTYFTRRHHCRRCGNIFCDLHSLYTIPLDQDANYHPKGTRSRACEHCWSEYRAWHLQRSSRSNSEDSSSGSSGQSMPTTPVTPSINCARAGGSMAAALAGKGELSQSVAASVPRDWSWSTF